MRGRGWYLLATVGLLSLTAGSATMGAPASPAANARPATVDFSTVAHHEPVTEAATLTVDKSVSPDPLTVGEDGTYTITVTNQGDEAAEGVTVTDELPAELVLGAIPQGCSLDGRVLTCTAARLAPGESMEINVPFTVDPNVQDGTNIVNTARAEADNAGGAQDQTVTIAETIADVEITKTAPAEVSPDGTITYTISVVNHGPSSAVDVTVEDNLDGNVETLTDRPAECPGGGLTLTCPLGTLQPGETATFTYTVEANPDLEPGTVITNCAEVYTGTPESNTDNDESCVDTAVTPKPDPTDSPTDDPTGSPTDDPTGTPTDGPTSGPTEDPTNGPTDGPTAGPVNPPDNGGSGLPITGSSVAGLALTAALLIGIGGGLLAWRRFGGSA